MNTVEETVVPEVIEEKKPKKSKGQLFKEKNGYSKSLKRNMKKHGLPKTGQNINEAIAEYRKTVKARKTKERALKRAKHAKAKAERMGKSAKPITKQK